MSLRSRFLALVCLGISALQISAQTPKLPAVLDPALKIEALATYPEVEACATVCGAPDGSFYVGCDTRDASFNTVEPECFIVRYSTMGADRKRTVFADKIYSPAGSVWFDGWLYVSHNPFLTRFKDTDGDGIADVREDLITNLGKRPDTGLNDHLASGFTLGMDGFFYMSIGDRGTYQTKSVKDGSTISLQGGGIIRFRPDGTALEIFSTGTRNHLAVLLDAEDNAFTLDNTDDGNGWWTRLTHHIEGGYYGYPYDYQKAPNYGVAQPSEQTLNAIKQHGGTVAITSPWVPEKFEPKFLVKSTGEEKDVSELTVKNTKSGGSVTLSKEQVANFSTLALGKVVDPATLNSQPSTLNFLPAMADFGGGSPTGGLCYLSDGLPEAYRGKLLFSEWGKGGLFVIEVARDGATFRFVKNTPLVQSAKGADFRPMQISVANDGSLLIADWGYGGWKGPKRVGTVWRLSWPEAKITPRIEYRSQMESYKPRRETLEKDPDVRLDVLGREFKPASIEQLLAALGHPDRDQRLRAQGALVEKGETIVEKLSVLVNDERAPVVARFHAIWTLADYYLRNSLENDGNPETLGWKLNGALIDAAHRSDPQPDVKPPPKYTAAVCAQAYRAIGEMNAAGRPWSDEIHIIAEPQVRLAAMMAYSKEIPRRPAPGYCMVDSDSWIRFAAVKAATAGYLARTADAAGLSSWLPFEESPGPDDQPAHAGVIGALRNVYAARTVDVLAARLRSDEKAARPTLVGALANLAYQPKPWDGHWWGTQPVKNPPPLHSVAWEGTAKAIEALTAALADADSGVRLAAAKACSQFREGEAPSEPKPPAGADGKSGLGRSLALPSVLPALRTRLSAETDPAIHRQLVESLGVQKDAGAMAVLTQIALDEKADADFRDTAINAVVNIGGDSAKKTIAQLASAKLSPTATRKIIQAAGELRVIEAAPALIAHLSDEDAGNRESAAKALGKLGGETRAAGREGTRGADAPTASGTQVTIADGLIAALSDKDAKVQAAAVEALGAMRDKRALPALLDFAKTARKSRELIAAIAAMPDAQALPFLVDALREKGGGERRVALDALKKTRAESWPLIEQALAAGRIPAEYEPEIREAFESGAIAKWKMIGPFENVWGAVHPPEKDALAIFAGE